MTWFKEGKPLKKDRVQMTQEGNVATLKIGGCSLLDAGEYTCALNNDVGGTFCTVNVNVEGKLRLLSIDSVQGLFTLSESEFFFD